MGRLRLALVDDHALFRAGLRALLEKHRDIEVVGEAADGVEAIQIVADMCPDVVLMDLMMPRLNGLEATSRIAKEHPDVHVIILSMNSAEEFVLPAVRAGARGFLLKDSAPLELLHAVKAVFAGGTYLSPAAATHIVSDYRQRVRDHDGPLSVLSPRQREVLQLVAEGNSTKEIAVKLGVTFKTAETYRTQLMDALDIHDIAGLTRFAIRHGVIRPTR